MDKPKFDQYILSTIPADKQDDETAWLKAWNELRREINHNR